MSRIRLRINAWFELWSAIADSINDTHDPVDCLGGYLT